MITVPYATGEPTRSPAEIDTGVPKWLKILLVVSAIGLSIGATVCVVAWLVGPAVTAARADAQERTCRMNVQAILAALDAYEAEHGTLPPAYSVDKNGKPMHSWRVLLLPYLGADTRALFDEIALNEPWNSRTNSRLNPWIPSVYSCVSDRPFATGDTSYCAVTGPGFAFQASQPQSLQSATDPRSNILWVVEVANSGVNWMEPRDISSRQLAAGTSSQAGGACCSRHPSGVAHGGFANGTVHDLSRYSGRELQSLATISGAESVIDFPPDSSSP